MNMKRVDIPGFAPDVFSDNSIGLLCADEQEQSMMEVCALFPT